MYPEKLKKLRIEKGYTLDNLGEKTGFTKGYLSLLERGLRKPSLESLRKISECLNVPMISFFIEDKQASFTNNKLNSSEMCNIIRKNNRNIVTLPEILTEYQFITPFSDGSKDEPDITGLYVELKPGCWGSEKMISHDMDESMYVIKGKMKVYVGESEYDLEEGDSIYIKKNSPHNGYNIGDDLLITLNYMKNAF